MADGMKYDEKRRLMSEFDPTKPAEQGLYVHPLYEPTHTAPPYSPAHILQYLHQRGSLGVLFDIFFCTKRVPEPTINDKNEWVSSQPFLPPIYSLPSTRVRRIRTNLAARVTKSLLSRLF
jgi:hypothetical protein